MKSIMMQIVKSLIMFLFGGILYVGVELAYRGYSHWTMFLLGGFCFMVIGLLNEFSNFEISFTLQMLFGGIIITVFEYIIGWIVNIKLGWNIWNYSNLPYNLHGQICLLFSVMWFFLSGIAIVIDDIIRYKLFDEEKPHYKP